MTRFCSRLEFFIALSIALASILIIVSLCYHRDYQKWSDGTPEYIEL